MEQAQAKSKELIATFIRDISQKNKTVEVIENYVKDVKPHDNLKKIDEIPFSSDRKYSACVYQDISLLLGAPEELLNPTSPLFERINQYTEETYRVVVFGIVQKQLNKESKFTKGEFEPLALIIIDDPIREDIITTLSLLARSNIQFKIISGDALQTVVAVVKKISKGLPILAIDGSDLEKLKGETLERAILDNNIFCRIKPHQKQLIIRTLRAKKLYTAMIGDGVNDVLAIREADLGIAITGGSDMVKDVADIVLLNNSFSTLPVIFNEGRRIITNIHNIANLYLIKNISSIVTILILGFIGLRFPFDPKHVELASLLIIGIPSLILAFDNHNADLDMEGFMKRLLTFSGVVGFIDAITMTLVYIFFTLTSNTLSYERTMLLTTVIFLGLYNILLIYMEIYPLKQVIRRRIIQFLLTGITLLFGIVFLSDPLKDFFAIQDTNLYDVTVSFILASLAAFIALNVLTKIQLIKPLHSLN